MRCIYHEENISYSNISIYIASDFFPITHFHILVLKLIFAKVFDFILMKIVRLPKRYAIYILNHNTISNMFFSVYPQPCIMAFNFSSDSLFDNVSPSPLNLRKVESIFAHM